MGLGILCAGQGTQYQEMFSKLVPLPSELGPYLNLSAEQWYANEFAHHDIKVAHEFLNIVFVASMRQYLSNPTHGLDEELFIDQLVEVILGYLRVSRG